MPEYQGFTRHRGFQDDPVSLLPLPVGPQEYARRGRQGYGPTTLGYLRLLEDERPAVELVKYLDHPEGGQVQVDVLPAEPKKFAPSEPGPYQGMEYGMPVGTLARGQEAMDFFGS